MVAKATSAATRPLLTLRRSGPRRVIFRMRSPGMAPATDPASSVINAANAMTRPSSRFAGTLNPFTIRRDRRPSEIQAARTSPASPPNAPSRRLSTRVCRSRCILVAPSDIRMENSRERENARPSIRFATLTVAISNTNAVAPKRA